MAVPMVFVERDQYPSVLEPKHLMQILGVSDRHLYEWLNQKKPPFHFVRVGKSIKISKEVFLNWLEGQTK
jgi:excisionase family DNA binding protein